MGMVSATPVNYTPQRTTYPHSWPHSYSIILSMWAIPMNIQLPLFILYNKQRTYYLFILVLKCGVLNKQKQQTS